MEENASLIAELQNSILIILDIQTKLTSVMPVKVLARLQRNTGALIKAAKLLNVPIVITEQSPSQHGNTEPDVINLLPDDAMKYTKTSFSCAGVEGFLSDLSQLQRKQLIIIGIEAHISVLQSAMDLFRHDYQVIVIADAVCSRYRESYETALQRLNQSGIMTANAESVIYEWLRDAKHEHYETLRSLVR